MKIEKITLSNLTSIEGEQTIDFTEEPLRSAGLFAITGDMGSGKSTILDAICLALYNKAPRFDNVDRIPTDDLKLAKEIIEGYEVKINQLKLGYHITAFINLEVAPVQKPDFYPFIKSCPNVVECNCVTGNYSMLLKVMFPSTMELDTFIGQLQKFGRTSTQIVFSTPVAPRGIDVNQEMPTDN